MSPNEILEDVRKRPFEPFRLIVSDGTHYDVFHPELCMVGASSVTIGLARDPASPLYERQIKIDCRHAIKTHLLPTSPAGTNGQQPSS